MMQLLALFSLCLLITAVVTQSRNAAEPCPVHPHSLLQLPSPIPDDITVAVEAVQNIFGDLVTDNKAPGVVVAIKYMSQTWTRGFGVKDVDVPTVVPDGDTIFRAASITKVMTVLMLYQLYDLGKVKSLDDPFIDYCPQFSLLNPFTLDDTVTLRQLASQMSGLPHTTPCYNSTNGTNTCPLTTEEILKRLSAHYRSLPSWTKPSYSNLAYSLLGQCLIENIYPDMTYEKYVENYILKPLEMTNTGFEYTDDIVAEMAVGYFAGALRRRAPIVDFGWRSPTAQMYSTTNDFLKLLDVFTSAFIPESSSKILAPQLVREMVSTMYLNSDGRTLFGTPWEMMFVNTYLVRTKSGNTLGYGSQFTFVPELGLGIVVLANSILLDLETEVIAAYEAMIPPLTDFLKTQKFPLPPNPEMYTGRYTSEISTFNTINIYINNSRLHADLTLTDGTNLYSFSHGLKHYKDYSLQLYLDSNEYTCLFTGVLGLDGAWMHFDMPDNSGKSPRFYFPWIGHRMIRSL